MLLTSLVVLVFSLNAFRSLGQEDERLGRDDKDADVKIDCEDEQTHGEQTKSSTAPSQSLSNPQKKPKVQPGKKSAKKKKISKKKKAPLRQEDCKVTVEKKSVKKTKTKAAKKVKKSKKKKSNASVAEDRFYESQEDDSHILRKFSEQHQDLDLEAKRPDVHSGAFTYGILDFVDERGRPTPLLKPSHSQLMRER